MCGGRECIEYRGHVHQQCNVDGQKVALCKVCVCVCVCVWVCVGVGVCGWVGGYVT